MSRVLILGGGFGGVVAAEALAQQLGEAHQITYGHILQGNCLATAVFGPQMFARVVDQDAPHNLSGDAEEMGATLPIHLLIDEL